ncbi:MAG: membrane or secreted protein [Bacteroidota bacterium]
MKQLIIAVMSCMAMISAHAQNLLGAWETMVTIEGQQLKKVAIFAEGYQVETVYNAQTGTFVATNGGGWGLNGNLLSETVEFNTEKPSLIGTTQSFEIEFADNDHFKIIDAEINWRRIDGGTPGALSGPWLMSARKRDGVLQQRDTDSPRKTMKILSGTRFQWIAYNAETKEFTGTGGGNYTTVDGTYTENIEFFSRDPSRVGISLEFGYELKEGNWHHSGLSSKGTPIYEVWSKRAQ